MNKPLNNQIAILIGPLIDCETMTGPMMIVIGLTLSSHLLAIATHAITFDIGSGLPLQGIKMTTRWYTGLLLNTCICLPLQKFC